MRAVRSGEKAQAAQIMIVTVPEDRELKTRRFDDKGVEILRTQSFFDFLADDVLGRMRSRAIRSRSSARGGASCARC